MLQVLFIPLIFLSIECSSPSFKTGHDNINDLLSDGFKVVDSMQKCCLELYPDGGNDWLLCDLAARGHMFTFEQLGITTCKPKCEKVRKCDLGGFDVNSFENKKKCSKGSKKARRQMVRCCNIWGDLPGKTECIDWAHRVQKDRKHACRKAF